MQKAPLYRRVNTRARGVHHNSGGDFKHQRNSKTSKQFDGTRAAMHSKQQRGLDYTPLFKFLLSKVGHRWDDIFSEAVARLDHKAPIFWQVARNEIERKDIVCTDEATFYSGLYVDEDGLLQVVNPALNATTMTPNCSCCTHTFNGVRFPARPT